MHLRCPERDRQEILDEVMDTKLRGPVLWLVVFIGGAAFQFWRGSSIDTLVYASVALLVIVAVQERFRTPEFSTTRFTTAVSTLLVSTLVFIFFPIHSWPTAAFYLLLVPILLRIVFQKELIEPQNSTLALRRSGKVWFAIGFLTCISELGNYFASDITHDDKAFPTLTVLVDPIVADSLGKLIFVTVWAAIGVGLFRVSTQK